MQSGPFLLPAQCWRTPQPQHKWDWDFDQLIFSVCAFGITELEPRSIRPRSLTHTLWRISHIC